MNRAQASGQSMAPVMAIVIMTFVGFNLVSGLFDPIVDVAVWGAEKLGGVFVSMLAGLIIDAIIEEVGVGDLVALVGP